jgi:hypothetical protein
LESARTKERENWKATCAAFQLSTSFLSDRTTSSRARREEKKRDSPWKVKEKL